MKLQHAKANEVIFRQGERSRCMYRVQRGTVGIFLDYEKPDEKKLTELSVGQYFGEMGLLESWPRSATAVVLSEQADLQVIYEGDFALCFQEAAAAHFPGLCRGLPDRQRACGGRAGGQTAGRGAEQPHCQNPGRL